MDTQTNRHSLSVKHAGLLFLVVVLLDLAFVLVAGIFLRGAFTTPEYVQLISILVEVVVIALPVYLFFRFSGISPIKAARADIGINIVQVLLIFLISITVRPIINFVNVLWTDLWELLGYKIENISIDIGTNGWQLALAVIGIGLMPALCEEYLFRGALLRAFESRGRKSALILSSIMFGIIHMTYQQVPYAVLLGVVLGMTVYFTGSFWASAALHFFINVTSVVFSYISAVNPGFLAYIEQAQEQIGSGAVQYITLFISTLMYVGMTIGLLALLYMTGKRGRERDRQRMELQSVFAENPSPQAYSKPFKAGYVLAGIGIAICVGVMAMELIKK